jgi:hypothetical protein
MSPRVYAFFILCCEDVETALRKARASRRGAAAPAPVEGGKMPNPPRNPA